MTLVQPSPEMQEMIRKELNEDVNTRDKDLETIKEWLKKQPHLPDEWGKSRDQVRFETICAIANNNRKSRMKPSLASVEKRPFAIAQVRNGPIRSFVCLQTNTACWPFFAGVSSVWRRRSASWTCISRWGRPFRSSFPTATLRNSSSKTSLRLCKLMMVVISLLRRDSVSGRERRIGYDKNRRWNKSVQFSRKKGSYFGR